MESPLAWIDVHVDLQHACDAVDATRDQRTLLSVLYNDPELSHSEAGAYLGWSGQRIERVTRSLRADRTIGGALRTRLAAYRKNLHEPVREIDSSAA